MQVTELGHSIAEVTSRLGVSQRSLYAWIKRYRVTPADRAEAGSQQETAQERIGTVAIVGWGCEVEWTPISQTDFSLLMQGEVNLDLLFSMRQNCVSLLEANSACGPQNGLAWIYVDDQRCRRIQLPVKSLHVDRIEPKETDFMLVLVSWQKGTWCEYQYQDRYDSSRIQLLGTRFKFSDHPPYNIDFTYARYGNSKVSSGFDFMYDPDFDDHLNVADVIGKGCEAFVVDKDGRHFAINIAP